MNKRNSPALREQFPSIRRQISIFDAEIVDTGEPKHYDSYMADCIHLVACRRLSKIARNKGCAFNRSCNIRCICYEKDKDYLPKISEDGTQYCTVRQAVSYARVGAGRILEGLSPDEVFREDEIRGITFSELMRVKAYIQEDE